MFATNSAGTKVWTATYTPFGGAHTSTGTLPTARFPGQWFQSESGLHQNWMRDYDPTTGRYLQADPLGLVDGASVYGYVGQSPMMYMDPTGQYGLPGALDGAIIGMIAAYEQTGCWQGAFFGAIVGAGIGLAAPQGIYAAMGAGAGESFFGQVIAYQFTQDICGCNRQNWDWRKAILISLGSALGGGLGHGLGSGVSSSVASSAVGRANGGDVLGPFLGGLIEGGLGEFGGGVGESMGTP